MGKYKFRGLTLAFGLVVSSASAGEDWLVDASAYKAQISISDECIVLDNGLARREIVLKPGTATTSLVCVPTGEQFVRGVSAEARVTFDGREYPVGGLEGQEVLNYLRPEWITGLSPLRGGYVFAGASVGKIEERFAWKKRLEWMARDLPWPPKGKHLVMHYRPPPSSSLTADPFGEEAFKWIPSQGMEGVWSTVQSDQDVRTTCRNEGFAGQIFVEKRELAYMERTWPEDAVVVIANVDCGTDTDGPATSCNELSTGLSVTSIGEDGIEVTSGIALSPARGQFFTVSGGASLERLGAFDNSSPAMLVAERRGDAWYVHAEQGGRKSAESILPSRGRPIRFQVGKIAKSQGAGWTRLHVNEVVCRRARIESERAPCAELPQVDVHYEIYDGAPLISKWLTISNSTTRALRVDTFTVDELRLCDNRGPLDCERNAPDLNLYAECNFQYYFQWRGDASVCVHYETDPSFTTQESWSLSGRNFLKVCPKVGVGVRLGSGEAMESCRVWELLFDSSEDERRGLALQRFYRLTCPWTAENPLMFHKTSSDPKKLAEAVDQCQAAGFEIAIASFGCGFDHENTNAAYRAAFRRVSEAAKAKGIAVGGYSLTAQVGVHRTNPVPRSDWAKNPRPTFGPTPCLATDWGKDYFQRLTSFMKDAGFGFFENDGPFPGYFCAATNHPYHSGKADSVWCQWRIQSDCYRWCRAHGVYVNQPDWYFLEGGNEACGGYRETNNSLPRNHQLVIERQNIYDNSWTTPPSMRWMFVPLTVYQGGGAAATIEPLGEHRTYYSRRFANLLGAGAQACWRGPRLYDSHETLEMVRGWTDFYKRHRRALDGNLIHLRRADGRDWDGWMMVDPEHDSDERAVVSIFNPLGCAIVRRIRLPLYYTGLRGAAAISFDEDDVGRKYTLDAFGKAVVEVTVPAEDSIRLIVKRIREPQ